jgi:regulation of enolase protein 1 (concanavalin A-like superfamily)
MILSRRILPALLSACVLAAGLAAQEKKTRTIEGWGTVSDPADDCTLKHTKQKLTVTVPGGTHDLNQAIGGMKAPRVLREVDGDFTAQVKVTGEFMPGEKAGAENTRPFNSGGLLLWQDSKNYIRLERNTWWVNEVGKHACFPPLIEHYKDGDYQNTNPEGTLDEFFKGKSTWLRLERKGDKVTASYSHDGKEWTEAKVMTADLPKKLQIGVAVVNTSAKDCTVEFEDLRIVTK